MLVTSKGAAAVSGGSFVVFAATVTAIGNSVATVVVSKRSVEFIEQTAKAEYSRVFGRSPAAAL
jgi:aerobic C4-dicarboxylate transport protein